MNESEISWGNNQSALIAASTEDIRKNIAHFHVQFEHYSQLQQMREIKHDGSNAEKSIQD
ncbi:MAG: hypothetical protein ACXWJZ_02195 [Burkholderiaceae bacterium]